MTIDKKTKRWIRLMDIASITGCHQREDRSFFYKGWQFPVCARCTGVIIGQICSVIAVCMGKKPMKTAVAFSGVMLTDWLLQYIKIKESTNPRRLVTGILGGFGVGTIQTCTLIKFIRKDVKT